MLKLDISNTMIKRRDILIKCMLVIVETRYFILTGDIDIYLE